MDFSTYNKPLLTKNNAKTIKGEKYGITTYIMYLAPYTQNSLGKNLCPNASKGCASACLYKSGSARFTAVQNGRKMKAEFFLQDRIGFLTLLKKQIAKIKSKHEAKGEKICIRLNGTSDLAWETFKIEGKTIIEHFSDVQFYDYTKSPKRMLKFLKGELPENYNLTFSRSEDNDNEVDIVLGNGGNVAVVFANELPETYKGFKVIDGDESDLRFLDEKNVVIGLKYKLMTGKGADNKTELATNSFIIKPEINEKVLA